MNSYLAFIEGLKPKKNKAPANNQLFSGNSSTKMSVQSKSQSNTLMMESDYQGACSSVVSQNKDSNQEMDNSQICNFPLVNIIGLTLYEISQIIVRERQQIENPT